MEGAIGPIQLCPHHLSLNGVEPERYWNFINKTQQSLWMLSLMPSVESRTRLSTCLSTLRSPASLSFTCLNTQKTFKGGYLTHQQNTQSFNQKWYKSIWNNNNRKVRLHPVRKKYISCHFIFFLLFLVFFGFFIVFCTFLFLVKLVFGFFLVIYYFFSVWLLFLVPGTWDKGAHDFPPNPPVPGIFWF